MPEHPITVSGTTTEIDRNLRQTGRPLTVPFKKRSSVPDAFERHRRRHLRILRCSGSDFVAWRTSLRLQQSSPPQTKMVTQEFPIIMDYNGVWPIAVIVRAHRHRKKLRPSGPGLVRSDRKAPLRMAVAADACLPRRQAATTTDGVLSSTASSTVGGTSTSSSAQNGPHHPVQQTNAVHAKFPTFPNPGPRGATHPDAAHTHRQRTEENSSRPRPPAVLRAPGTGPDLALLPWPVTRLPALTLPGARRAPAAVRRDGRGADSGALDGVGRGGDRRQRRVRSWAVERKITPLQFEAILDGFAARSHP
ncbi:hypothetical protein BD413DRAFT_666992 [Trametes elegans]|nr:hypothetical protein BD413DRAFT_666992 [Trametes elegans]